MTTGGTDAGADAERLFELCPDLLAVSSFDGYLLKINAAWSQVLGWSREELLSRPYGRFVHPDDLDRTLAAAQELIAGGSISAFANRYRHRDGGYRWLSWDATGDPVSQRMYAAIRDVTEERRTAALRDQLEEITGVGTWEIDLDTEVVYWSEACHRVHGTDPAGPAPRLEQVLDFYPSSVRVQVEQELAAVLARQQPRELEVPFVRLDGSRRWVELTASVLQFDGRVARVFGTIEDITDRVEERQRLRRFHDLLELTEEGIAELAADGTITYANARLARMVDPEDAAPLEGRASEELLHPQDATPALAWFGDRIASGDDVARGVLRLAAEDAERWAQVALRVQRSEDGTVAGGTAVFTDVTERVRRERELEESRLLLEEAQTLARIGHWRAEVASGQVVASPVVDHIMGRGAGDWSVTDYLAAVHTDDRGLVPMHVRDLPRDAPVDLVHRLVTPTGKERTVHLRATMEPGEGGHIDAMRGTLQDVTALHRTEQALQRVLRATNDGWWDEDLVAGEASYSDRWWEIHGLAPQRGRLPSGTWRRYVPPEELPQVEARFAQIIAEQRPTFELRGHVLHSSGRKVPVVVRGSVQYDQYGRALRVSGATSDITEEERAARAKEVFVSTVSHELRTPLTAIGGALELLAQERGGALPASSRELVDVGLRNADRLRTLVADLLDVEQLRTGSVTMHLEPGPLSPIVTAALEDLTPTAHANRVAFDMTLPEHEPLVHRDADRIGQVLRNLLSNAVKYAPAGSTVEAHVLPAPDIVRAVVIDRGPGLPASFEERAFERFAQADPDDPRSRGGTGLGLAISREIIQQHGGEIGYESRPGATRFWFSLPTAMTEG